MIFRFSYFLIFIIAVTILGERRLLAQQIQASLISPSRKLLPSFEAAPNEEQDSEEATLCFVATAGQLFPTALNLQAPSASRPRVFSPSQPRSLKIKYPWKFDIMTTVFWVGELPTRNNPVPNTVSAWDKRWTANYGGYDDPDPESRDGYLPKKFTPGENPFYFALPYNDISRTGTKDSARKIPWFEDVFYRDGRTVLKGRWIAIRKDDKICYAQWEDVGPFETDDWEYVFGDARPHTKGNRGAGLDVSPAVRDYLEFGTGSGIVDWRFVDVEEVPEGPWKQHGMNNPFVNPAMAGDGPDWGLRVRDLRRSLFAKLEAGTE